MVDFYYIYGGYVSQLWLLLHLWVIHTPTTKESHQVPFTEHISTLIVFIGSCWCELMLNNRQIQASEMGIPSSTVVDLPPVKMSGDYRAQKLPASRIDSAGLGTSAAATRHPTAKGQLFVTAEVGSFQHMLTTDLLNHLVFVQKSFMKVAYFPCPSSARKIGSVSQGIF